MKLVDQLEAMPDAGMVPVSFARQAVAEVREHRLSVAEERVETIEMWVRIGTRHYSGPRVPIDVTSPQEEAWLETDDPGRTRSGPAE